MTTNEKNKNSPHFVFFGTAPLAGDVLDQLEAAGLTPALIVAGADRYDSRKKENIFPPEKEWALERSIPVIQPEKIDDELISTLNKEKWDVFMVASYGKILPKRLLDIPRRGTINMHPSLLPRLRGPSPIRSAILTDEKNTGVSIMLLDEELDHGPLLAQKKVAMPEWPPRGKTLDAVLATEGGKLTAEILPLWVRGEIEPREQNHDVATYCKIFTKEDGLLDLSDDPYKNLLKIRAFDGWPGTYTFMEKNGKQVRVQILDAHIANGKLILDTVKPEGKGEMPYADFLRSIKK